MTTNQWTAGGTSDVFSDGSNWSTGTAPGTDREDVYIQNFDSPTPWTIMASVSYNMDSLNLFGGVNFIDYSGNSTISYLNILQSSEFQIGLYGNSTSIVTFAGGNILNDGILAVRKGGSLLIGIGQENYNNSDTEIDSARTVLSGSGTVVLDGGTIASANFSNLIVAGTTIEGNGSIGGSDFVVIVEQNSFIEGQYGTLTINPTSGDSNTPNNFPGLFNLGTIEATSGSIVNLDCGVESVLPDVYNDAVGFGSLVADDSSTFFLSNFISEQSLSTSGSGLFEIGDAAGDVTSAAFYEDYIEGAVSVEQNATLHFGNAGTYEYDSPELDNGIDYVYGTISVYGGSIVVDSSITLSGETIFGTQTPGTLNLSAGGAASTITAASAVTLTNGITIEGQGMIGDGNNLLLVNQGTIDADLAGTNLYVDLVDDEGTSAATGTNSGLMEATNGAGLLIASADHAEATFTDTGTIAAFAGSTVVMSELDLTNIANGVLTGGVWEASGSGSDLEFDPDHGFTSDAATIILSGAGSTIGEGGTSLESELIDIATGGTLEVVGSRGYTTSNALTLEGTLQLGGGTFASGAITGAAGSSLTGYGTVASVLTTAGGVTASGGTLTFTGKDTFSGALTGTSAITLSKNVFTLGSGASIAAAFKLSSATLSLGTSLTITASFSETSSNITFASASQSLTLGGTTTLTRGSTSVGTLGLTGTATSSGFAVTGGGVLAIGGSLTLKNAALTLGSAPTSGAAAGIVSIRAGGVLDLFGTASIVVAAGATGTLTNAGTLERLENGGIAKIGVATTNTGMILVSNGTLDFTAAVSGAGKARIENGGMLEFDAAATGAVSFATGGGELKLGAGASFKGSVAAFGAGDTIDVGGFGTGTTYTYRAYANGAGGTLTLKDGAKTVNLILSGSYSASGFHLTNGSTDTAVTYAPPTAKAATAQADFIRPIAVEPQPVVRPVGHEGNAPGLGDALFEAAFTSAATLEKAHLSLVPHAAPLVAEAASSHAFWH